MIFHLHLKSYLNRCKAQHKRVLHLEAHAEELEQQRNTWIRRAIAMATADDLAQWAREGGGPWDIQLSGRKS